MADTTNLPGAVAVPDLKDVDALKMDKSVGGEYARGAMQAATPSNLQQILNQILAPAQEPSALDKIGAVASAAGTGITDPQTLAILNSGGASTINAVAQFAKSFGDSVNSGMAQPTWKDRMEAAKLAAEQEKGGAGGADKTQAVAEFWNKNAKPITETLEYYNKAAQSFNKENPAPQDDANIYAAYLKTQFTGMRLNAEGGIDPTSMSGVKGGAIVMDYMNALLNGTKKMRPEERLKYMNAAASNLESYKAQYDTLKTQAEGIAKQYGVDAAVAVPDYWKNAIQYKNEVPEDQAKKADIAELDIIINDPKETKERKERAKELKKQILLR